MKNILFVGNSYTYYSDMPEKIFAPMAEAAGFDCRVTMVAVGNCTLSRFADEIDTAGQKLRRAIAGQHYDIAVLQEQGLRPITEAEYFEDGVARLLELLRPQAEHFMLYAPSGRREGHRDLAELGMTYARQVEALAQSHEAVGRKFGLPVAHAGRAVLEARDAHPEVEYFDADRLHPSYEGSVVAAKTILDVMMKEYGQD